MFTETTYDAMWGHRSRRGWTTIASFTLQGMGIGLLLILPITHPEALPSWTRMTSPIWTTPSVPVGPPPSDPIRGSANVAPSNMSTTGLVAPPSIPSEVASIVENTAPPPVDAGPGVLGGSSDVRATNWVIGSFGRSANNVTPPPTQESHRSPPVSVIMTGYLIHRVEPIYPPLAKTAGVQGPVVLAAVISRQGAIENLQVLSGHPMLVRAAVDAVQQWCYRPYVLNGEPVQVETQVTVNFVLSR